jgi:hypothetical protein
MRKLALYALASFLFLWGLNLYIIHNDDLFIPKLSNTKKAKVKRTIASSSSESVEKEADEFLIETNIRELDKIGDVINEKTVKIDSEQKAEIKKEKIKFDNEKNLQEKVTLLEQSFLDRRSTVKDIKRLQSEVQELKHKMKLEILNTEKWDPMFVYYLMISENYTYLEINQIKSLSENGITSDELNYINDLIKQKSFKDQVLSFKNSGDIEKVVASVGKRSKPKEQDEFVNTDNDSPSLEDKLIEMNYGSDQRDEMIHGHSL